MKIAMCCIALLISSSISFAETLEEKRDFCKTSSESAEVIMTARQVGRPMSEMLESTEGTGDARTLLDEMIIDAYGYPRFSTERIQTETINDFRDKYYLECVKYYHEENKK